MPRAIDRRGARPAARWHRSSTSDGRRISPGACRRETLSRRSHASGSPSRATWRDHAGEGDVDAGDARLPVAWAAADRRHHAARASGCTASHESRRKPETAQRLQQRCAQAFRYAIATARDDRDPVPTFVVPWRHRSRSTAGILDADAIGKLLRTIDGYTGNFVTKRFALLTTVRNTCPSSRK